MGLRGRAYVEVRHDWDLLADRLAAERRVMKKMGSAAERGPTYVLDESPAADGKVLARCAPQRGAESDGLLGL
jgi:hypothetical protein